MAKYRVRRPFPSKYVVRKGTILVDPKIRNLSSLIKLGHLVEVKEERLLGERPDDEIVEIETTEVAEVDLAEEAAVEVPAPKQKKSKGRK